MIPRMRTLRNIATGLMMLSAGLLVGCKDSAEPVTQAYNAAPRLVEQYELSDRSTGGQPVSRQPTLGTAGTNTNNGNLCS